MQDAVNNEQYPELIEMLLSGDIRTFRERLQSFIDQLPDNKRSANKKGFFPLFVLGGFLALPDTKLGKDLGVKQVYYHIEKDKTGYVSGVKFAIPIEKQNDMKLLFIVVSDDVHIKFTREEISYIKSKLGSRYDKFSKVGYSIPIEHLSPTEYQSNIRIGEIKGISRSSFTPQKFIPHGVDELFVLKKRTRERDKDLEELVSKYSFSDVEEVSNSFRDTFNYFDPVVQEYIIRKSGHFKHESDYHGLFAGFFVMLFKYRYNLKSYLELSLGEGFSDIVVLVRSPERSDNAISIIIELKAGKTLTIQGTPFDQAGKYAEAFKYGPQRMITNNDNVIYAVYNPDLPNNRIKIDKTARDKQHPKPFLQSVLESADPAQIREQLKYIYYSIPNLAENYYRYTSEVLLGELMPTRTKKEVWNKYIFKHEASVSNDITSFGFVNSGKNELVLLNIIRGDSRSKKINIDEVIGKNKEVNVKLGMHESIRGNRNLKIREVNLLLETKKARAGEFQNWCRKVQVNSYDNLNNYNTKKTQSFSGEFAKLDIDVNKLKNMLDNAVDKKGTGAQSDNAEHYKKLFTEVSSTVFPIKEMINNEIDFQAILHGLFMYYSDSQMSGGSKKRIGVIPEVQSGGGKRIDIGVVGGEEFTGIELKFSETQGIADGLTTKAKEAESQLDRYKKQPNNVKSLTDSERAKMFWAVFHKGARTPESLIETRDKFDVFQVVHSSMHVIPHLQPEDILEQSRDIFNQQCNGNRKKRNINMACIDSRDEEKITEEEKEQRIKELFNADKVAERVKNIEFYDQLFKVSQQISKGEIIDKNVEEAFAAKIKDVDLDSIDSEIRDIVKEMKDNIENKEEVKNVLRRSGVTEKIGKVAEGAGLAFTAFLVGKHIANGDIEGLGYDALNLWVMPKIGEKISGKILELGTKLDSQMLKGFAPAMGRAIGNFAAFLGLAESIKARQSATDPVDIKIADLNIATNSIFIAADVPAVVTETMSVAGLETGVVGEFAGPVGAAVSVAVIIISQFVKAGLEVEKLTEQMSLTDQEKHDLYWDFFLGKKVPDYIERDIGVENIYKQYMSKILDQFKSEYDTIAISLPSILITKEKYVTNNNSRKKRQGEEITNWLRARDRCITRTRVVNNEFGFDLSTNITHPFHMSGTSHYSRIIPGVIKNYNLVCGPLDDNVVKVTEELLSGSIWDVSSGWSCGNSSPHNNEVLSKTREEWSLQKYMTDCYNAALYNKSNSSGLAKMLFYMSNDYAFISVASNYTIDVLFNGKNILLNSYGINNQGSSAQNRYYFTKQLSNCDVHKQGTNFFYIAKDNFVCNLGGSSAGQSNTVITRGNFKDSEDIHSVIGSNEANHIEVSHAGYVDGKGGNDVITAKNFTAIKGYFGDSIRGKGLVLLPINFSDIDNITHVNNITTIYNKSGAFISVDKQTSVKTADGLFVTPTKIDGKTGVVTNLHVTKSLSSDIVLDDELDNLRKIDNSNFNITKQLSSANYHSTIGSSSNHIFYPDKEHHNFYWEAPSNISHLYLFDNRNANITIAQANGILDFSQLNCTLDDMPFTENNEGEIKINKNGLNVTLLPNYKDVTVTFNGEEYYKLQNGELERDYCSHSLRIDGRFSVNGTDLLNHHNCFTFDSEKVLFLKLNNNLLLLSDRGALSISDYYSSVNKNWDLSIELNNRIMEPEEFGERADDFSSFRYYKPDEQGLQIYHNQPINKNDIGLVDLKDKSILDFDMKVINDNLLLSYKNNTLVKVENWNSYQPAREMMFAFNDKMVSNSKCIASTCNSGDVIVDFNEVIVRILKLNKELLLAVRSHELNEVKNLISQGASLEAKDDDDNTPLHWASWNSYLDVVDYLIKSGANLEAKNRYGRTPLLNASWNGHLDVVKYLVENGANLEAKDYNGKTPLHMASLIGHLDVVKYLISKGADINAKANDGKTPLDIAIDKKHDNVEQYLKQVQLDKKLLTAMEGVDLNEVRGLIAKGANIDTKDKDGNTLLYSAAEMGDLDRIKFLLDNGANIETENGEYQATPLHGAVENYRLDAVKLLLSRGANVNAEDKGHWTPLHYAADTNRLDVVKFLVGAGANLGATSDYGKTPLDIAIDKKHVNVEQYLRQVQLDKKLLLAVRSHELNEVKNLISQGASLEAKDGDDNTPLHWASWNSYLDIVEYLIKSDANLEAKNRYGRTPLLNASWNGHLDVVKYLVENGANLEAKDYNGKTPLYRASLIGHLDVVKYLISKGASINAKDKDGKTPLDIAIDKKLDNVVAYLRQTQLGLNEQLLAVVRDGDFNKVKDLVGRGASLDIQDSNNGWTPIIYAAQGSKWDMVKFLIAQGAKFNNEITYQGTPLHFAAQEGNSNMVQFLLDKGADIEAQNAYNKKPLHLAVEAGKLKVVRLLLDRGANIKAADMYGQTPLDLAIKKGYEDIVEVLKQKQLDLDKELLIAAEKGDIEKVRDSIRQGANVNVQGRQGWTPVFWAIQKNNFNIIELLLDNNADIKVKDNEGWTPLHWAVQLGSLDVVERLVERGADVNALTADGRTPYDLAINQNYREVKEYLRSKSAVPSSMLIPDDSVRQRKRRHHHGDHSRNHNHSSHKFLSVDSSNQPEIAANSGTRPSLWINGLFGWVKGSVGGLFYSRAALSEEASNTASSIPQVDEQFAKASVSSSSSTSTTLPSDGTDKKQENGGFFRDNIDYVNANIKQMRERQTPVKFKPSGGNTILEMGDHYLSQIDFNGTIMLLDLLIRKVTGQKYISTVDQSISPLEAQGYALNITEGFEKVVEQAGLKSGVSMHRLNIDFVEIQKEVTGKIMSGKFDEISGVLNSYLEEACPGREAGCPGKLSPKKFDKFIAQFNKDLLNQSIEQILHNRDGTLEVDGTKKQQMSLEPQSYLSNASVHSHSEVSTCLSEIGVTKLGGNLNR